MLTCSLDSFGPACDGPLGYDGREDLLDNHPPGAPIAAHNEQDGLATGELDDLEGWLAGANLRYVLFSPFFLDPVTTFPQVRLRCHPLQRAECFFRPRQCHHSTRRPQKPLQASFPFIIPSSALLGFVIELHSEQHAACVLATVTNRFRSLKNPCTVFFPRLCRLVGHWSPSLWPSTTSPPSYPFTFITTLY